MVRSGMSGRSTSGIRPVVNNSNNSNNSNTRNNSSNVEQPVETNKNRTKIIGLWLGFVASLFILIFCIKDWYHTKSNNNFNKKNDTIYKVYIGIFSLLTLSLFISAIVFSVKKDTSPDTSSETK
jgi:hypothetical protein